MVIPELLEACLDLLGDGLEPLLLPPGPSIPPPPSSPLPPFRAVSLNSCRLTLAFLPPPEGPATAFAFAFAVALANAAKLFPFPTAAKLMAESREPTTEGRSKMELPAEDETAPSDEAGEMLRGVFGNGESGTGLDVKLGGEVGGGDRGVGGAARTSSDKAREMAAGVGGGGDEPALGSCLAMMRGFTYVSRGLSVSSKPAFERFAYASRRSSWTMRPKGHPATTSCTDG